MLCACKGLDTEYLVFFDDDIFLHEFVIQELVGSICNDSKTKVATGYSIEVPQTKNLVDYMLMVYRSINALGFMTQRVNYVWGGCVCVPLVLFEELLVKDVWTDGGYSDDMLLGNVFKQAGYKIVAPTSVFFENRLRGQSIK